MRKILFVIGLMGLSLAQAKVPTKVETLIIGAGLSGLATAYELKKAGHDFQVFELTSRVGGRVRTVEYDDPNHPPIVIDSGMEEYWESNPAVKLLQELKLPLTHSAAVSSLVLEKKLYTFSENETSESYLQKIFNPNELAAWLKFKKQAEPWLAKILSLKKITPELEPLKTQSFADWVAKMKLPKKVSEWIRISLECEIGTHWDRISAVDGIAEFHLFLNQAEESYRVIGGNEKFTNALYQKIGPEKFSLHARVTRIEKKSDHSIVHWLDVASHQNHQTIAKNVVSTVPLYRLFEIQFEPKLSATKLQAIASQTYGAYFKAHVFFKKSAQKFWQNQKGVSILPILSDSPLGVIYEVSVSEASTQSAVSLLVHGDVADGFNMMALDDVRSTIKAEFAKLWPGSEKQIEGIEFYRLHPRAIAAWPVGRSRYDDLANAIRQPENNIYLAGDFTESSHSDGAFISAYRVVDQILKRKKP